MSNKIYEIVTERIITEMEKGNLPWKRPWVMAGEGAISHVTGKPYSMLNQWLLSQQGEYLTFNQARTEGGRVIKGSKAEMIVFFKLYKVTDTGKDGKQIDKTIPLLRYYNVFHISRCEGIKPKVVPEVLPKIFDPIEEAERVACEYSSRESIPIIHAQQNRAYYTPLLDQVTLPIKNQFSNSAEYYSTLYHELAHSSGHQTRLNRFNSGCIWQESKDDYSKEELVAEITAATILATIGIESESSFSNNLAYIQSWISALRNDKSLIISAASKAEKAVALIMDQNQVFTEEVVEEELKSE